MNHKYAAMLEKGEPQRTRRATIPKVVMMVLMHTFLLLVAHAVNARSMSQMQLFHVPGALVIYCRLGNSFRMLAFWGLLEMCKLTLYCTHTINCLCASVFRCHLNSVAQK